MVNKTENCWNWIGHLNTSGYGHFQLGRPFGVVRAPRYSWELHNGPIPKGTWVLHKCDNRACVNPSHLFIGNGKENYWDMVNKGRQNFSCGERNRHKLTEKQIKEIRNSFIAWSRNSGAKSLAEKFGVGRRTIEYIVHKKSWKHIL